MVDIGEVSVRVRNEGRLYLQAHLAPSPMCMWYRDYALKHTGASSDRKHPRKTAARGLLLTLVLVQADASNA